MVNTEKPTGKTEAKKNLAVAPTQNSDKKNLAKAPVKDDKKTETEKVDEVKEEKKEAKKVQAPKVKKEIAVVNAQSVPVSTKYAVAICKFIRGKRIGDAIRDLEDVSLKKKHVPMIGEYGHKHGEGKFASGAGKYPVNASKQFIVLLKSLAGNANVANIDEPIVAEAISNKAQRPMGRFGRWERKRTHVKLVAREMKVENKKSKNKMEKK